MRVTLTCPWVVGQTRAAEQAVHPPPRLWCLCARPGPAVAGHDTGRWRVVPPACAVVAGRQHPSPQAPLRLLHLGDNYEFDGMKASFETLTRQLVAAGVGVTYLSTTCGKVWARRPAPRMPSTLCP